MSDSSTRLGFAHGLMSLPRALGVLWRAPRVLLWLAPPLLITLLLDVAVFSFAFDWIRAWIAGLLPASGWLASLRTVLDVLGAAVVIVLLGLSFSWVFLALASPFQDFISAAVEREVRGSAVPDPAGISGFLRSLLQSLVQAVVLTFFSLIFLLLAFFPVVGPILFFVWSAFALGYSFVSVHSGRTGQTFAERRAFARRHLGAVMGLGSIVAATALIPLANVLLMPIFVVAGTLLHLDAAPSKDATT
ncbi:MAG: EI24 domain-containing protein [Chthoniobacter sp.]|nr:EI24 domain-containing protein [Chthoniobacter sp.]